VIFMGPDGVERHRVLRQMETTWRPVADLTTDVYGMIPFGLVTRHAGTATRLEYTGDGRHRPTAVWRPATNEPWQKYFVIR
jgi:hypothetical protein